MNLWILKNSNEMSKDKRNKLVWNISIGVFIVIFCLIWVGWFHFHVNKQVTIVLFYKRLQDFSIDYFDLIGGLHAITQYPSLPCPFQSLTVVPIWFVFLMRKDQCNFQNQIFTLSEAVWGHFAQFDAAYEWPHDPYTRMHRLTDNFWFNELSCEEILWLMKKWCGPGISLW